MNYKNLLGLSVAMLSLAGSAHAQESGEVVMKAAIGSFKINSPGDRLAYGAIEMSFKGSLLLSGLDPKTTVVVSGNVRKEYENAKEKKVVYFGQGKVVINGKFLAIQWFGRNLDMKWVGMGICRLFGEFDKEGNTGTYQLKNDQIRYWGSGGTMFLLPSQQLGLPGVKPKVKIDN